VLEWFERGSIRTQFNCVDFDGATFKIYVSDDKSCLIIAFKSAACASLIKAGGMDHLQKVYGPLLMSSTVSGFDVSLSLPGNTQGDKPAVAQKCAALKSYLYASPLLIRMEAATKGQTIAGLLDFPLRSNRERMFVKQDGTDRMTVIFSIEFKARNDAILGEVFCNEFATIKDTAAPSVTYSAKPPLELKGVSNLPEGEGVSYLSFVLYDRHWKGNKMEPAAFTIVTFRNYLHYHLKCCKSYLHTRMRTRVENLLKVLNRAKQAEATTSKKTATGRTFTRK